MKFKQIAIGLSVIAITNVASPTIKVFADVTNKQNIKTETSNNQNSIASISKFKLEGNAKYKEYKNSFKVDSSKIQIKANKQDFNGTSLENIVDEDKNTFWAPSTRDSETSKTEVEYIFDEVVTLDRISYSTRQNIAVNNNGFPNQFEIYGSTTDDGEYELVSTGGGYEPTKDTVEIKFKETEFKKLKFKFVEPSGSSKWAHIGEMAFFKPDSLIEVFENIFTDSNKNQVSEEYKDINKLNELGEKAKEHPFYDEYKQSIEDAKSILENTQIESTQAKTSIFNHHDNEKYNELFKMDNSNILSIKNNAGHYAAQNIEKAIDGDLNTYWETNKGNSATFNNEVEITFKEKVVLDRLVYGARQGDTKGFAEEFEIYASKTSQGDTYQLVSTGEHNRVKGLIEAKFEPTEFKRIKFKFKKSNQNWASLNEILFYEEDKLNNELLSIFTDETRSELKEEYRDINKLNELEEKAKKHPFYDEYKQIIEDAKSIVENSEIESTQAQTIIFNHYENEKYSELFKMDNSNILSIKNNGGHYKAQNIEKAIDGDLNTYWETNKANGSAFNNEVEITFKEKVVLDRLVYGARPGDLKGFAEEFEIYASKTSQGDTYQLVSTGKHHKVNGLIEAKFEPTQFKRIKFKFKKSNQNWATANEFVFYKEDKLYNEMFNIFTDGTWSDLKEEYKNINKINELKEQALNHPLKEELIKIINVAEEIVSNNVDYTKTTITANQFGNMATHARNTLNMNSFGQNLQPTGFYALPGDKIKVYVDVDSKSGIMPVIQFSQNEGSWRGWRRGVTLQPGLNEITVPGIDISSNHPTNPKPGGAIYIENPYTSEQQGKAPVIRIEGAQKYPFFKEGDNEEEFKEFLVEYKKKLDEDNISGEKKVLDITAVDSDRMLLSGTASGAYDAYINKGVKPSETTTFWDETMEEVFKLYGLDGSSEINDPKYIKEHMMIAQPYGSMYAASDHIGVQKKVMSTMFNPTAVKNGSWGFLHETGHRMDTRGRIWGEVTNNMLPMYMSHIYNNPNVRVPYSEIYKKASPDKREDLFNGSKYFESLGMFWQLQLYNEDFWPSLNKLYRERKPNTNQSDTFIEYSSEVFNKDLTEYFDRHGLRASDEARERISSKYEKLDKKLWYLNDNAFRYEGNSINKESKPKIERITNQGNMIISSDIKGDELLGYEIIRDGKIIGFTDNSNFNDFKDETDGDDTEHKYQVRAYGKDLSTSSISDEFSLLSPSLKLKEKKLYLKTKSEFNPLAYINATDYEGQDISANVEVTHNVNTSQNGTYSVEYTIQDQGITLQKSMTVEVVSDIDYASDVEWVSATSGWREVNKDKAVASNSKIKLKVDGEIKQFNKGIGAATNSEIVYNLEGKNYNYFSTYLGTDKNYNHGSTSIDFKIVADGVEVYKSNTIRKDSEAEYVSLDITGVNELKLIADDHEGNGLGDYASYGDTKFITLNTKPTLDIDEDDAFVELNSEVNLLDGISASDIEDGDITSNIVLDENGFNINKVGEYEVSYTITDSDGNVESKSKKVIVYSDKNYASDVKWESATSGWREVNKDKAVASNNKIKLKVNGKIKEFDKGIGAATNSEIVYNLEGKGYNYFSTYLGTDKNYNDNRTSIDFKILADGVEVYKSNTIRKDSEAEYVSLDISGVNELKLIAGDHDGSGIGDFISYGDAKFYTKNAKPTLEIEKSISTKVGEPIENVIGNIIATDTEDGDLTSKVVVSGHENIDFNKPGEHTITYTVTDSDNNTKTKKRNISVVDMRDAKYLTEYDWKSAVQSYSTTKKDTNVGGGQLKLTGENNAQVVYEKGIGSHANATIIYDLSDKDYKYFTSYVGIDRAMYNSVASVSFEVYVDGEKKFDSGLMRAKDQQKFVEVDINKAKELKLVVKDGGNGIGSDHASWGDTKLHFVNEERANITKLQELVEKAEGVQRDSYTEESLSNLDIVINEVKEILESDFVSEAKCNEATQKLQKAIDSLESLDKIIKIEDKSLEQDIKNTLNIQDRDLTLRDMHSLTSLTCESGYVNSLKGLEYALNLESLNIDDNEVSDISVIKNLKKLKQFSGKENYIMKYSKDIVFENNKIIIEDIVIDADGERILPKEVVLSPNKNPQVLDLYEVLIDGKIVIDTSLTNGIGSVEIRYESENHDYQLISFAMINK